MKINQLFTSKVDIRLLLKLLTCFSLNGLNDKKIFSKYDIIQNNTISKINEIVPELETYYLPCKAKLYLSNITEKRAITILKQVLRLHGYYLFSKEKNYNGAKTTFYQVNNLKDKIHENHMKSYQITNVLSFD